MRACARFAAPPAAVVFDFNGTLSDDEPLLLQIYTELFREYLDWSMTPAEYFDRLAGLSDPQIVACAVAEHGNDDPHLACAMLQRRAVRYQELVKQRPTIRPGALELVRTLVTRGVPQAVVTGASRKDVISVLYAHELAQSFGAVVCNEDVAAGKPDPEGFRRAAAELGVPAGQIVVFEDSVPGLRAARAAGMVGIGLVGTRPTAELEIEATAVFDSLDRSTLALLALDHVDGKE